MRKLLLFASLLAVALGSTANAATLTIALTPDVYTVGSTVTLTVTADPQGASALLAFGRLLFDNSEVVSVASGTPTQSTLLALGGALPWLTGPLTCTSSSCEMMNQISPITATPATSSVPLVASVSFLVTGPGITNVTWDTNQAGGFALDFFGLTNAPGISIPSDAVPEPTTAALLGLGLCALAIKRRREV